MKVGLLTFHEGINHGAYLQCYALYCIIQSMGHDLEVINYKNFTHWLREYWCFLGTLNPLKLLENIRKIIKFRRAQKIFKIGNLTFSAKKVGKKHFDTIVVGSDMVWDFNNHFFGFDPIYFGQSLNTDKLVSYAATFGDRHIGDKPPQQVLKGLLRFDAISVRDGNSKDLVNEICNREAKVVLDPTLLYDFSKEERLPNYKKFILVYGFFMPKDVIVEIKNFARERGLKLIAIGYRKSWCDINEVAIDPFEWLGYFKKADFVLTSKFHGALLSIKYNKLFCLSMNDTIYYKIKSILNHFSLEGRVISPARRVEDILGVEIKYESINTELRRLVSYSKEFLERSLND